MHRPPRPGRRRPGVAVAVTAVAVTAVVVLAVQAATVITGPRPEPPAVRTVSACPSAPVPPDARPATLVADLDTVRLRDGPSRPALLAAAEEVLAGTIPVVRPGLAAEPDPLRYLFDEGVALRRVVGVLGYAYAATRDPRYLDALAAQTVRAARWADWNPGHPLDTAQVAAAVALGFGWSRQQLTPAERAEVLDALGARLVTPYVCTARGLGARRTGEGNQATVVATAAVLAGLAAQGQADWAEAAVRTGTAALARYASPDGTGRSLADGPTAEGLMYTTYEAANLALLAATGRATAAQPALARPLAAALPSLDALAGWTERCGRVAEPAVEDGWDRYPWVDRTTALAAMAGSPAAGPRLLRLYETLQAQGRLTLPGAGEWVVPDGLAELVLSGAPPVGAAPPPATPEVSVSGGPPTGRYYGCTTYGDTYALLTAVPNDAPHAHADIGNLVVTQAEQTLLADLGQRSYSFTGQPVWRAGTKAHSTLGVAGLDGLVTQRRTGTGAVSADGGVLVMTSTAALPGVGSWQRRVTVGDGSVQVRDVLTSAGAAEVPLSMSFLLAAPTAAVTRQPDGTVRFQVADGSVWDLVPPPGTTATVTDAAPQPPYVDGPDLAPLAAARTLVVLRVRLAGSADLTTVLRRAG